MSRAELAKVVGRLVASLCAESGRRTLSGKEIYEAISTVRDDITEGDMANGLYYLAGDGLVWVRKDLFYAEIEVTVPDCSRLLERSI